MKMVRDTTGRFPQRPHYSQEELDRECELIVSSFLKERRGAALAPITTDELSILIEQHATSLDPYADLARFGDDVEGMTAFSADGETEVSISERLSNASHRENRLRTTLAHEFGHLTFHRDLWADQFVGGQMFDRPSGAKAICKRDTILNATEYDWMEWQAGYVSGAILMPASQIRRLVSDYCGPRGLHASVLVSSRDGIEIMGAVADAFQVSEEAARVRLLKLSLLASSDRQPSLFD